MESCECLDRKNISLDNILFLCYKCIKIINTHATYDTVDTGKEDL